MKAGFGLQQSFPFGQIDMEEVRRISQKAERLGFDDLWVAEGNVAHHGGSLEPINMLSYVAAVTDRIRLGTSVIVLPPREPISFARQVATLDQMSGGRLTLGVGLGNNANDAMFGIGEKRVRWFTEQIQVMNSLWQEKSTTFDGMYFHLDQVEMYTKPVQKPRPPLWIGARVEAALRRAVRIGDGWQGQGSSSTALFLENVGHVRRFLDEAGRDPSTFAISKRVIIAIDDDDDRAIQRLMSAFDDAIGRPEVAREVCVWGSKESVFQQLDEIVDGGAEHLLLSPWFDYDEHLEAFAEYAKSRA